MRCPKCGYNSFDYLESCKKCGKELVEHKQRYGIKSVLFPGQLTPVVVAVDDSDHSVVDAAVAAATAATIAGSAASGPAPAAAGGESFASEADDFGFDFMGESDEEEDLSFDELFEEAPVDEDVEETLPSPEPKPAEEVEEVTEFSFDSAVEEDPATEEVAAESDLDSDFGFDLDEPAEPGPGDGPAGNLAADDFELPSEEEEGFDFNADEIELGEAAEEEDAGTKGDPKDPFELPESPRDGEAPEQDLDFFTDQPLPVVEDDSDLLFPEPPPAPEAQVESVSAPIQFSEPQTEELSELAPEPVEAITELHEVSEPLTDKFQEPVPDPFAEDDLLLLTEVEDAPAGVFAEDTDRAEAPAAEVSAAIAADVELSVGSVVAAGAAAAIVPPVENEEPAPAGFDNLPPGPCLLPSLASRVAAFFCDLVLLFAVAGSFIVAAETAMSGNSDRLLPSVATLIDLSIPYFLVLFSLAFGYFTLFHFLVGQTPGKMLTGLRVETLDGEPLVLSQAFLRSVGGLLQLLPVGLGYLVALLNPERRGWNDRLAGTQLVSLKGGL